MGEHEKLVAFLAGDQTVLTKSVPPISVCVNNRIPLEAESGNERRDTSLWYEANRNV